MPLAPLPDPPSACRRGIYLGLMMLLVFSPIAAPQETTKPGNKKPTRERPPRFLLTEKETTVVFLGDNIMAQRVAANLIEAYVLTRFPDWPVHFRNVGLNGDTMDLRQRGGIKAGVARDITPLDPSHVIVMFGMNDARGGEAALDTFEKNAHLLYSALRKIGSRVIWCTPSGEERAEPDEPGGSAFNRTLGQFAAVLREHPAKIPCADVHTPFLAAINAGRAVGLLGGENEELTLDGIHPTAGGHLVIAWAILKGMNAPPMRSVAHLDAANRQTVEADGCKIQWAEPDAFPEGVVVFRRLDDQLPMPLPDAVHQISLFPGVTLLEDLADYRLRITGLTADEYILSIDGEAAGPFRREELEEGIDLNFVAGPTRTQVAALWMAVQEKNALFDRKWREVGHYSLPEWLPDVEAAERARQREMGILDGRIQAKESEINALRHPKTHVFQLTPI